MAAIGDRFQGLEALGNKHNLIQPARKFDNMIGMTFQDNIGAKNFEKTVIKITTTDNVIHVGCGS
jgi:hypothetical protein